MTTQWNKTNYVCNRNLWSPVHTIFRIRIKIRLNYSITIYFFT